jgi:hypothetical protein
MHARSVHLTSERLGITAKIDLVEGEGDRVTPVDYKRGKRPHHRWEKGGLKRLHEQHSTKLAQDSGDTRDNAGTVSTEKMPWPNRSTQAVPARHSPLNPLRAKVVRSATFGRLIGSGGPNTRGQPTPGRGRHSRRRSERRQKPEGPPLSSWLISLGHTPSVSFETCGSLEALPVLAAASSPSHVRPPAWS